MGKKEKKKIIELLRKLEESSSSENEEETPPRKRCRVMISSDSESSEEEQVHPVDQTIVEVHTEPSGQNTDKSKMNILGEVPTKSRQIGVEANPEIAKQISHYCLLGFIAT